MAPKLQMSGAHFKNFGRTPPALLDRAQRRQISGCRHRSCLFFLLSSPSSSFPFFSSSLSSLFFLFFLFFISLSSLLHRISSITVASHREFPTPRLAIAHDRRVLTSAPCPAPRVNRSRRNHPVAFYTGFFFSFSPSSSHETPQILSMSSNGVSGAVPAWQKHQEGTFLFTVRLFFFWSCSFPCNCYCAHCPIIHCPLSQAN